MAALGIGRGELSEAQEESEEPYFQESSGKLTLGNRYYEVDFDKSSGAITRIFDKRGGGVVSEGNADGSLWGLAKGAWPMYWGTIWPPTSLQPNKSAGTKFGWSWHRTTGTLSFEYDVPSSRGSVQVNVDIAIADAPYLDLTARVDNRSGAQVDWFEFPDRLSFLSEAVEQAMLPYAGGVLLNASFFRKGGPTRAERYPSWESMGDLVWLQTPGGSISIYPLHGESEYWKSVLGFQHGTFGQVELSYWRHVFALALAPEKNAELPTVRLRFGATPIQAVASYRDDNGIDQYPGLKAKVGDYYEAARRSPTIETSPGWDNTWPSTYEFVDSPVFLHPTNFQRGGNYALTNPDWWPPDDVYGGPSAYRRVFSEAQRDGKLIIPFTSLTAVHEESDTVRDLEARGLTIRDIAAHGPNDELLHFTFSYATEEGGLDPVDIIRPSPSSREYLARLDSIMADLEAAGSDFIYEDGAASPGWWYDAHPDAISPLRYWHGWLEHAEQYADRNLTGEGMYDRMSRYLVGGYYSIMFFEDLNAMPWDADNWSYFPAAAAMFRDQALLWSHNYSGLTDSAWLTGRNVWTVLDVFRWHFVVGQLLTLRMPHNAEAEPWLPVVTAFSHHVVGPHSDELLTDFRGGQDGVTESVFETVTVTANWTDQAVPFKEHTLVPGGVMSVAHDGSMTGGVFERYNGRALSEGEHYLIEQRKHNGVIIRQPMGPDTPLTLKAPDSFQDSLVETALNHRNELATRRAAPIREGDVSLQYQHFSATASERVEFEASITLGDENSESGLREIDIASEPSVAIERDGRGARRPFTRENQHNPMRFALDRQIAPAAGADVTLAINFFDENRTGEYLGVAYDSISDSDAQSWDGPAIGNGAWRTFTYQLPGAVFQGRRGGEHKADFTLWVPHGLSIGKVTVTNADELERRTVAYYTIHDPAQGETLTQGLHLRGWADATQPIVDLDLDGLQAIYAWDAEAASWLLYSPDVPARFNTLDMLEQGRAYYVRVRNGQTLHWPDAPYGGVGFHLQSGRNLVCWLGTPDKSLTDAIAPLRGMKAEPLVSVTLNERTYDVEESRSATEPLPYGQALWVEIDAVGPTRWLQF